MIQLNIPFIFESLQLFFVTVWENMVSLYPVLPVIWFWYQVGAYIFITTGVIFAFSLLHKILAIRAKENAYLAGSVYNVVEEASKTVNPRWQAIVTKAETDNAADWKLAIIEADTILDEMVKRMGYPGDNLGERLKAVEVSDFLSLNEAWEAHKVRNQIAHEADFTLDKRKTGIVIDMYKKVFDEFGYI